MYVRPFPWQVFGRAAFTDAGWGKKHGQKKKKKLQVHIKTFGSENKHADLLRATYSSQSRDVKDILTHHDCDRIFVRVGERLTFSASLQGLSGA